MARGPRDKFEHAELGQAFKWMRADSGFTQRDLAEQVASRGHSISSEYYSECERGVKYPSKHKTGVIVETLGYSLDDLDTLLQGRPWARETVQQDALLSDALIEADEDAIPPMASNFLAASDPAGSFHDQTPLAFDQVYSLEKQSSPVADLSPLASEYSSLSPPLASSPYTPVEPSVSSSPPIKSRMMRSAPSQQGMARRKVSSIDPRPPVPSLPESAARPAVEGTLGEELAEVVRLYADAPRGKQLNALAFLRDKDAGSKNA